MDDNEDIPDEETGKSDVEDSATSPRSQSIAANDKQTKQCKLKKRTNPVLPSSLIKTALDIVDNYLADLNHEFIDTSVNVPEIMTEKHWEEFIRLYYQLIL